MSAGIALWIALGRLSAALGLLSAALAGAAGCAPRAEREAQLPTQVEILRLEDRRNTGDGILQRLAASGDGDLRIRAALALGRIGAPVAHAGDLAASLADPAPAIRSGAAFALGEMGDPNAVALLLPRLSDADRGCRAMAAEALGKLSDPNAIAPLLKALDDADDEVAGLAMIAIFRLEPGPGLADQAQRALAFYQNGSPARKAHAVYFLMRSQILHPESRAPHDAIVAAVKDADPLVRAWTARGIGACNTADPAPLVSLAADPDWRVRVEAFNSLRRHGVAKQWEVYRAGLDDPHPAVALASLSALEKCPSPEAAVRLERDLAHETPRYREIALIALAGRDKAAARDRLRPLREDPVWSVRARLAEVTPELEDEETFLKLAGDADSRVRSAAAGKLAAAFDHFHIERVAPLASNLLWDSDVYVRSSALDGIAELPAEKRGADHIAHFTKGYTRGLPDAVEEARLSALAGLAAAGGDAARDGVIMAMGDASYLVRRRAAEILRDKFAMDRFADVGEAETHFKPEDYEEAARRAGRKVTASFETASGTFRIELYAADAPLTVHNFVLLARAGKLDAHVFHRVVPGFVIQDGDPRGDGSGGPPYRIRCEINMRRYGAGAVGMALSGKDTGGSQYFATQTPQPHLDGGYTLFGQVIEGQEIVDRMVQGTTIQRVTIGEQ